MNVKKKIEHFSNEREWEKFHNAKDLSISITLEAAELLECFQWKTSEESVNKNMDEIREELADILIYSYMLASNLNLDVEEIMLEKLKINEMKYPVDKVKGKNLKYNEYE